MGVRPLKGTNMQDIIKALKQAEQTLWLTQRYGKEFDLKGMEQDAKKSLAAVRKAIRELKQGATA
jgi:hypothetical protein